MKLAHPTRRIARFTLESGERYCALVDAGSGLPLWYPNLYATTQVRNAGRSLAAMEAALRAVSLLLGFADGRGIDLESRLAGGPALSMEELDELAGYCARRLGPRRPGPPPARARGAVLPARATPAVSPAHRHQRLTRVADYLAWLSATLLGAGRSAGDDAAIERARRALLARRPRRAAGHPPRDRALPTEALERLLEMTSPEHPDNPFACVDTAERNALAIRLLSDLGIRRGELLGVRVRDIDFQQGTLWIHRRPDDPDDPRPRAPSAKTLARQLALSPALSARAHAYVAGPRRRAPGAARHPYLLVVHQPGPRAGRPLTISGLAGVFARIRERDPLLSDVHPHALRHTWNARLSEALDRAPPGRRPAAAREEQLRGHHMGWRPGSGTAGVYNARHIRRQAARAALELQEGMGRGG